MDIIIVIMWMPTANDAWRKEQGEVAMLVQMFASESFQRVKKRARLGSDRIAEKFKGGSNFYYPSPSGFISLSSWMVGLFA